MALGLVQCLGPSLDDLLASWYRLSLMSLGSNFPSAFSRLLLNSDRLLCFRADTGIAGQVAPVLGYRSLSHYLTELAQRNWRVSQVSLTACRTLPPSKAIVLFKRSWDADSILSVSEEQDLVFMSILNQ